MRRRLYGKGITPACSYCLRGVASEDKSRVFCMRRGIVANDYRCRRFKYDPLRRVPRITPELEVYSPDDFSL